MFHPLSLSPPATSEMIGKPDVAHVELRSAELRADRLSAAIRVIVLLSLLAVFASMEVDAQHQTSVALCLTAYGSVTTIAVVLAWRGLFHPALAYALATLDIALVSTQLALLVRLFSLPHAAVYSTPAAGLIYVVLAHVSLRFRPRLILYAAVLFVASLEGARYLFPALNPVDPFAHSFEPFIYGHALPLSVIGLTTLALWAGSVETRHTLSRAIEHARRAANLSRFFSQPVADRLAKVGAGTSRGDRRQVAILFVDVRGFAMLGQDLTPEALATFLTEFRSIVTDPVFRLGGSIDKYIGDAVLVIFGSPDQRPDDAARAIRCGQLILQAVTAWSNGRELAREVPVRVGIGAHYGNVFAGVIGQGEHLEFTVIGDAVNIAERVERLTRTQGTDMIVSEDLLRATGRAPDATWRRLPEQVLPGHGGSLTLFALR